MPLYNEIVWAKYSAFKFWPALTIALPADPDVVFRRQHKQKDISSDKDPCGLNSNCINRALLVECNPKTCPASESCQNQCFKRKQY
ncbi:hypothetical protein pipiens_019640 [Culex pipiens pipiens]|uniref:AWS domain-containing protein n=1 Tax=Culex pipiens pipiens TaxID=38569 RepID=A0ABD1DT65_CULPP